MSSDQPCVTPPADGSSERTLGSNSGAGKSRGESIEGSLSRVEIAWCDRSCPEVIGAGR